MHLAEQLYVELRANYQQYDGNGQDILADDRHLGAYPHHPSHSDINVFAARLLELVVGYFIYYRFNHRLA